MTKPLVILGADGQVGRALRAETKERGLKAIALSRADLDLTETESIALKLDQLSPAAILNAAAYTRVDGAEEEEAKATLINGQAPGIIAAYCRKKQIPLVHYSTDYVFNGEGGERAWRETDPVDPVNAYGRSKLKGEETIRQYGEDYLIFRTSWVYDAIGNNFVRTMLRLGKERDHVKVVDDQWGAPSYAPHIAAATLDALQNAQQAVTFPSGLYHLCGSGETSWYQFAKQIFTEAHKAGIPGLQIQEVRAIPTSEYPTPAPRPLNSRLDCSKARQVLGVEMPHWEEGLRECMALPAK